LSSLRSSIKKKLNRNFDGLADTFAIRQSDNLISLLLDLNLNKTPISFERVDGWHNALFEGGYYGAYKIKIAKFRDMRCR